MLNKITIVGSNNVGKSSLFNFLVKNKNSLVYNILGSTRNYIYGFHFINKKVIIFIDTGGIIFGNNFFSELLLDQFKVSVCKTTLIYFMLDIQNSITYTDLYISNFLIKFKNKVIFVINKIDLLKKKNYLTKFFFFNFSFFFISVFCSIGIVSLILYSYNFITYNISIYQNYNFLIFTVIGQPNTGKSTLVNLLLENRRSFVSHIAGTTLGTLKFYSEKNKFKYIFIDTLGVTQNKKFFFLTTFFLTIDQSNVIILIIDITKKSLLLNLSFLNIVFQKNKPVLIILNKTDLSNFLRISNQVDSLKKISHIKLFLRLYLVSLKTLVYNYYLLLQINKLFFLSNRFITEIILLKFFQILFLSKFFFLKKIKQNLNPLTILFYSCFFKYSKEFIFFLKRNFYKKFNISGISVYFRFLIN